MLLKRFTTALVLAAIGVPAIIYGGIFFWLLMAFFLGVAAWEYVKLFRGANFQPSMIVVVGGVLGVLAARTLAPVYESAVLTGVVLLAMVAHLISFERGRDQAAGDFAVTVAGIVNQLSMRRYCARMPVESIRLTMVSKCPVVLTVASFLR